MALVGSKAEAAERFGCGARPAVLLAVFLHQQQHP